MPLVIPVIWLSGYIMYRIGKKEIRGGETEYDRWGVWYWVVAGAIGGKWLFHVVPNATLHTVVGPEEYPSYGIMSFGVFLGLCIMVLIQEVGRVWHENPNYTSSPYVQAQEEMVDKGTMTRQENVQVDSLLEFTPTYLTAVDKVSEACFMYVNTR